MFGPACPTLGAAFSTADAGWMGAGALALAAIALLALQLQRKQREYAADLAEQSDELQAEREKLRRVAKEKESLASESQAKSEMLATLSREIRAHLNGVIGSADLLIESALQPHQREHLTTLRGSAESLVQSLNDVLDYSSIESGQIRIADSPFDLRHPLTEVMEVQSAVALLKGLDLVLVVAPDVPLLVSGDAVRLRQILFNLTANAVKFTSAGRVVLRVSMGQGVAPEFGDRGDLLHFSITDTGTAIPADSVATIFDRMPAASSAAGRRFGGSGLELAISKRLVELMGGRIGARTLPEAGTEFWFVLPLPAEKVQPTLNFVPPNNLHVVLLDSLAASRVAVSAMLTRMKVEHDASDTIANAAISMRDAAEEERDVVLLLDESMAKSHADALSIALSGDDLIQSVRVVLMSRDPDSTTAIREKLGVASVVRKPLLAVETLGDALKQGSAVRAQSRAPFAGDSAPRRPLVLVVDDDAISRSVSSQLLSYLGCDVDVAASGGEAIERTKKRSFELIFMDCQMPEMDGFMTTERIRINAGTTAPPIVAVTANTSLRDRERCFSVGMCDFVGKPVTKSELARVLKRWGPVRPSGSRPQVRILQ
jgi:two-component system sensor histidine kinase/response regulator